MRASKLVLALTVGLLVTQQTLATNGYFSHGFGIKSQGLGGAGIALPQDTLSVATNPAGMVLIGSRVDLGLSLFQPDRGAILTNTAGGSGMLDGSFDGNGRKNFFIPEAGYNRLISEDLSLGISVYGNGGMNTDYKQPIALLSGATGNTSGIDYIQLFVSPSVAWKLSPGHAIGASINLGYQRFKAKGIENFTFISTDPANVTGLGTDDAMGIGFRIGWIGQISEMITLGASYQSTTWFQKFDKYKGLFAGGGRLNAPSNFGVGIAVAVTPQLTITADVQRILFSEVNAIGNSIALWNGQPFIDGGAGNLGSSTGPGFGWENATVFKLGASYEISPAWTLRAGFDHTGQPIPESETLFNILAPGVVQDHLSLGATWTMSSGNELSFAYTHAFQSSVTGTDAIPAQFGGGDVSIDMNQNSFGIAYGWKF